MNPLGAENRETGHRCLCSPLAWRSASPSSRPRGDWDLVADLGISAILVHSRPFDSPELAGALATGASALVVAGRIDDHFLAVLRMVSQGYLVVDSKPSARCSGPPGSAGTSTRPGRWGCPS